MARRPPPAARCRWPAGRHPPPARRSPAASASAERRVCRALRPPPPAPRRKPATAARPSAERPPRRNPSGRRAERRGAARSAPPGEAAGGSCAPAEHRALPPGVRQICPAEGGKVERWAPPGRGERRGRKGGEERDGEIFLENRHVWTTTSRALIFNKSTVPLLSPTQFFLPATSVQSL